MITGVSVIIVGMRMGMFLSRVEEKEGVYD